MNCFEEMVCEGGLTSVGCSLLSAEPNLRIGTMVAANQGRPGGACGACRCEQGEWVGEARSLHAGHSTQEEDVVSNWLLTDAHNALIPTARVAAHCSKTFRDTIFLRWGFKPDEPTTVTTMHGVDFTTSLKSSDYSRCWVVDGVKLSNKTGHTTTGAFDMTQQYRTSLFFVGGPNAGAKGSPQNPESSTRRTYSPACAANYALFYESVKAALRAGLLAMAHSGCDVALLAGVSAGLYAGPHKQRINDDFRALVNSLLYEEMNSATLGGRDEPSPGTLGECFKRVIWTKLH
jgi:hypothetical protein